MDTYFVRHNRGIDIDDQTRQSLWKGHRIAIHYLWDIGRNRTRDTSSLNPEDYKGSAKQAMKTLVALSEGGGYVCAEHHRYPDWMLGFVSPKSKIALLKGKWGDKYGRSGRTAILKTLRQVLKSDLPKSTNFYTGAVCPDIRVRAQGRLYHVMPRGVATRVVGESAAAPNVGRRS